MTALIILLLANQSFQTASATTHPAPLCQHNKSSPVNPPVGGSQANAAETHTTHPAPLCQHNKSSPVIPLVGGSLAKAANSIDKQVVSGSGSRATERYVTQADVQFQSGHILSSRISLLPKHNNNSPLPTLSVNFNQQAESSAITHLTSKNSAITQSASIIKQIAIQMKNFSKQLHRF